MMVPRLALPRRCVPARRPPERFDAQQRRIVQGRPPRRARLGASAFCVGARVDDRDVRSEQGAATGADIGAGLIDAQACIAVESLRTRTWVRRVASNQAVATAGTGGAVRPNRAIRGQRASASGMTDVRCRAIPCRVSAHIAVVWRARLALAHVADLCHLAAVARRAVGMLSAGLPQRSLRLASDARLAPLVGGARAGLARSLRCRHASYDASGVTKVRGLLVLGAGRKAGIRPVRADAARAARWAPAGAGMPASISAGARPTARSCRPRSTRSSCW